MAFQKITELERAGKGNVGQPDTPNKGVTEMQEQMDSLANLAIDKFNELVDKFGFSPFQLAQAEKFYITKNVPFLWHFLKVNKTGLYGIC